MKYLKLFEEHINENLNKSDLEYAKIFADKYKYTFPNKEEIYKSNEQTDKAIKDLINRHNSFLRGVESASNIQKYSENVPPLDKADIQLGGYEELTKNGTLGLLFTTNNYDDAYGYGKGNIAVVRRNVDFSGDRKSWINKNDFGVVEFTEHDDESENEKQYNNFLKMNINKNIIIKYNAGHHGIIHYIFRGHPDEKILNFIEIVKNKNIENFITKK